MTKQPTSLVVALAAMTLGLVSPFALAGDEEVIPPEILAQMDPKIRASERPTIREVTKSDIWSLRDNPAIEADFVTFSISLNDLSSVQKEILMKWVGTTTTPILLRDGEVLLYDELFTGAEATGNINADHWYGAKLREHPVNTDCKLVKVRGFNTAELRSFASFPAGSDAVVTREGDGAVVCGRFAYGRTHVYFMQSMAGQDSRRWILNWWHWALGLAVPGAAETDVSAGGGPRSLAEREQYDEITLKNGDTLSGTVLTETVTVKTSYADLAFKLREIERVMVEGGSNKTDALVLHTGDRISGVVQNSSFKLRLVSGSETDVTKDKLQTLRLRKVGR